MKVKRFNEKYDPFSDEYTFMTEMHKSEVEIDYKEINLEDVDWIDVTSCSIYWNYELDENRGGIDGIIPSVVKITLAIEVFTYNEETEMDDDEEMEFEFTIDNAEFEIKSRDYDGREILPFYPRSVEFGKLDVTKESKTDIIINYL